MNKSSWETKVKVKETDATCSQIWLLPVTLPRGSGGGGEGLGQPASQDRGHGALVVTPPCWSEPSTQKQGGETRWTEPGP